jgi:hypothetical protein
MRILAPRRRGGRDGYIPWSLVTQTCCSLSVDTRELLKVTKDVGIADRRVQIVTSEQAGGHLASCNAAEPSGDESLITEGRIDAPCPPSFLLKRKNFGVTTGANYAVARCVRE